MEQEFTVQTERIEPPLIPAKDTRVCPNYWVRRLLTTVAGKDHDPLFSYVRNGQIVPITYEVLVTKLKQWVHAARI